MVVIKGKIIFNKTPPSSIPDGSLLEVNFQDTSLADADAITLGKHIQIINGYKSGDVLTYEIECDRPECPVTTVSNL